MLYLQLMLFHELFISNDDIALLLKKTLPEVENVSQNRQTKIVAQNQQTNDTVLLYKII